MIDVGTLHQHYLFLLHLASDGVTHCGVAFVAVNAFELHGLTIYIIVATGESEFIILGLGILDLYLAETNDGRYGLKGASLLVEQFYYESVTVGSLGSPLSGIRYAILPSYHTRATMLFQQA